MTWARTTDGRWLHRPWWKVAINTVLRRLQPGVERKWVVYTVTSVDGDPPVVHGYGFGRIRHLPAR